MRGQSVMEGEGGGSGMMTLFDLVVLTSFSLLDKSERMHDLINNVILTIVEMRVPLHDLSKQSSQKHTIRYKIQRISLTGFPAQSVGSSNTDVLDSPCLLVLITGTSQSRQHESCKSPTAELFEVDSGRISIRHCEY
ncbi:hypothetical protein Tco_1532164 [Tanacetum coccineum]